MLGPTSCPCADVGWETTAWLLEEDLGREGLGFRKFRV